jgi:glutaredoxin 3
VAITLWVKSGCPYCDALKRDLAERGVAHEEIDVERNPHLIPELLKLTGRRRIVPVLVHGTRIEVAPHGGSAF